MSETLSPNFITHVPTPDELRLRYSEAATTPEEHQLQNGAKLEMQLDDVNPLIPREDLFAQTGFDGKLVAEIGITQDPNRVLAVIDGREAGREYGTKRFLWAEKDGDRAQTFSSNVVLAELIKTVDADGSVSYQSVPNMRKGVVATGIGKDTVIGRDEELPSAKAGFTTDMTTSRNHIRLSFNEDTGTVELEDLHARNGSNVKVLPSGKETLETDTTSESRSATISALATEAMKSQVEIAPSKEFMIHGVKFELKGVVELSGNEGGHIFRTTDAEGVQREVIVYKSNSEGGYRVTQGMEIQDGKRRILKGAELDSSNQYTQDTQLHPEFREHLDGILEFERHSPSTLERFDESTIMKSDTEADRVLEDFAKTRKVYALSQKVHNAVSRLRPGQLNSETINNQLGINEEAPIAEREKAILEYTDEVSKALKKEKLVPDFSTQPVSVEVDNHPVLGSVTRETFNHKVGGRVHQWTLAHDGEGRVWIDRIRLADTSPTAYGTDSEMLYSGILTSKPIDYAKQTTGLPASMTSETQSRYIDITKFLDNFGPIKDYRKARGLIRST